MNKPKHYTLEELSIETGTPVRSIRWYIQQQLVDKPEGQKRGAYYLDSHLQQLRTIRHWQEVGLSLEAIRHILKGEVPEDIPPRPALPGRIKTFWHIRCAEGVELVVDSAEVDLNSADIGELAEIVRNFLVSRTGLAADPPGTDKT